MSSFYNTEYLSERLAAVCKERDELKKELAALKQRGACLDEQMDAGILVDLGKHNGDRTGMGNHKETD